MAEFAFAIIALPESLRAIWEISTYVLRRVKGWRDAPRVFHELDYFGVDLYESHIRTLKQLAEASLVVSYDSEFNRLVKQHSDKLDRKLDHAQTVVSRSRGRGKQINRLYFINSGEHDLRESLEELRKGLLDFRILISSHEQREQLLSKKTLLTHRRFRFTSDYEGDHCTLIEGTTLVYQGKAELRNSGSIISHEPIITERWTKSFMTDAEKEDMLAHIALQLSDDYGSDPGLLQCLGWRAAPLHELVFRFPTGYADPRSLRSYFDHYRPSANERRLIAKQVSDAVLAIARRNLVHKNLQTDSVLIFRQGNHINQSNTLNDCRAYVINWQTSRLISGLSDYKNVTGFRTSLYRHPERCFKNSEVRYHTGHDLYSLGVLLLEIGLWESLATEDTVDGEWGVFLCDKYQDTCVKLGLMDIDQRDLWRRGRGIRGFRRDYLLEGPKILACLARDYLLARMPERYTKLVIDCLQCVDDGFCGIRDWTRPYAELEPILNANIPAILSSIRV